MAYLCLDHLKAGTNLIKNIKIHYCFTLENNKLQTQSPFCYHKSFLRMISNNA